MDLTGREGKSARESLERGSSLIHTPSFLQERQLTPTLAALQGGCQASSRTYLDLRQLQYLWENADVVGMCDKSVQPFAVSYGCGNGFKLVPT